MTPLNNHVRTYSEIIGQLRAAQTERLRWDNRILALEKEAQDFLAGRINGERPVIHVELPDFVEMFAKERKDFSRKEVFQAACEYYPTPPVIGTVSTVLYRLAKKKVLVGHGADKARRWNLAGSKSQYGPSNNL